MDECGPQKSVKTYLHFLLQSKSDKNVTEKDSKFITNRFWTELVCISRRQFSRWCWEGHEGMSKALSLDTGHQSLDPHTRVLLPDGAASGRLYSILNDYICLLVRTNSQRTRGVLMRRLIEQQPRRSSRTRPPASDWCRLVSGGPDLQLCS